VSLPFSFSLILIFCECTPLQPNDKPRDPRIKIEHSLSFTCGFSDSLVVGFFFGYGCSSRDSNGNDGLVVGSSGDFWITTAVLQEMMIIELPVIPCFICIAAMKTI
jgi:hypothetical protein